MSHLLPRVWNASTALCGCLPYNDISTLHADTL